MIAGSLGVLLETPAIFDPSNEPYLGLAGLLHLDQTISRSLKLSTMVAAQTAEGALTPLQLAATEIIPHGISIALSIRELIRQGYLLGAEVLVRPLVERAAVITYLSENPDGIVLWNSGWPYKSRPSLATMLKSMLDTGCARSFDANAEAAKYVSRHNSLIHADPAGARSHASKGQNGRSVYSSSKNLNSPDRCHWISLETASWLAVLMARMAQLFPDCA